MLPLSVLAGLLGTGLCYLVGYLGGDAVLTKLVKRFPKTKKAIDASRAKFTKYGAGAVCIASVGIAAWSSEHARQTVYVIDKGSAVMARRTPEDANRDMEAADHVTRFHELMFNLAPSSESIKRNVDRALTMSDRSGDMTTVTMTG